MPCCLSAFEWEITKFHMLDNNVFIFGGLNGPGATCCQYNSSSGKGSLADMIGRLQGYWHADISDPWVFWTFGILLLKLPPGSDPGPFMFGRCGIYVRETGILILYLVFRGNDLHCGYAPTYDDKAKADCVKKNFAQHGQTVMGSHHDRYNRLGREIIWGAINVLKISGLKLAMSLDDLFRAIEYEDEDGNSRALEPLPINLDWDSEYILYMRGLFASFKQLSEEYLIRVTKDAYQSVQACFRLHCLSKQSLFPVGKHRGVHVPAPPVLCPPLYTIAEVCDRQIIEGKVTWTLCVHEREDYVKAVESDCAWLHHQKNAALIARFLESNIPQTTPALAQIYKKLVVNHNTPGVSETTSPTSPTATATAVVDQDPMDVDTALELESSPSEHGSQTAANLVGRAAVIALDLMKQLHSDEQNHASASTHEPELSVCESRSIASKSITRTTSLGAVYLDELVRHRWFKINNPAVPASVKQSSLHRTSEDSITSNIARPPSQNVTTSFSAENDSAPIISPQLGPEIPIATVQSTSSQTTSIVVEDGPLPNGEFIYDSGCDDCNEEDGDDDDPEPEEGVHEEDVYEILKVVGYKKANEDDQQMWCVRWKNYDRSHDTWLPFDELRCAQHKLSRFNERHSIVVKFNDDEDLVPDNQPAEPTDPSAWGNEWDSLLSDLTDLSSEEEEYNGSEKRKKGAKRKLPRVSLKEKESVDKPMEDVQLSLSKKALEQLFSSETLAEEYKMLEQDWNLSQSCKVIPIPHLLNQIALNDSLNNFISSYLFYSPLNDNSAFLSLACLQSVVQQYPTLIKADQHLETLSRTGPALASALVKAYKEKQLESQFPAFVSLINHIVWYIEFKQNAPKPPRKKPRLDTTVTDVVLPSTGSAGLDVEMPAIEQNEASHSNASYSETIDSIKHQLPVPASDWPTKPTTTSI
ncbi:hypothetical protein B0H10DRAFT_1951169 [Mycena sp. CBHHK59/15]|nr:hypothetical protein B0H10DRAFT_1951169 [Mycena sp. CBHHK59/15]